MFLCKYLFVHLNYELVMRALLIAGNIPISSLLLFSYPPDTIQAHPALARPDISFP